MLFFVNKYVEVMVDVVVTVIVTVTTIFAVTLFGNDNVSGNRDGIRSDNSIGNRLCWR